MITQVKISGTLLNVEYDYQKPEPGVGFNGQIDIEYVDINGEEISDLLSEKAFEKIESEIWNQIKNPSIY